MAATQKSFQTSLVKLNHEHERDRHVADCTAPLQPQPRTRSKESLQEAEQSYCSVTLEGLILGRSKAA